MKKTKGNEIFKAAMAAVLSIGLFSAAFIGVNNFAFAAATNKTETIPSVVVAGYAPSTETNLSDDYQKPVLVVYEYRDDHHPPADVNAIPFEEAAQIGAKFIWDVLGVSIDGMTVEMAYRTWPSHTTSYWYGTVAENKAELEVGNRNPQYFFIISAISGEWKDIFNCKAKTSYPHRSEPDVVPENDIMPKNFEIIDERNGDQAEIRIILGDSSGFSGLVTERGEGGLVTITTPKAQQPPEGVEEYARLAEKYSAKHFDGSEIVKVEYVDTNPEGYAFDEHGNLIIIAHQLHFTVTDSIGREARVTIKQETKDLLGISTQYNDIIPGCTPNV